MQKKLTPAASKLLASALTMLIALLMVVGSTLAWFTISANPEIGGIQASVSAWKNIKIAKEDKTVENPLELDFRETVSLNDVFENFVELRPVSTADLKNWFLPTYVTSSGMLRPAEEFICDPNLRYANVFGVQTDAEGNIFLADNGDGTSSAIVLSGAEMLLAEKQGYYLYTDFWIKTEEEEGTDVYLSIPNDLEKAITYNDLHGLFGTYVLPLLTVKDGAVNPVRYNSECAFRLGFAIYKNGRGESEEWADWFIYEPNADRRSEFLKKPVNANEYIAGYTNPTTETDGTYIATQPIGFLQGETEFVTVPTEIESRLDFTNTDLIQVEYTVLTDSSAIDRGPLSRATYYVSEAGKKIAVNGREAYVRAGLGQTIYTRTVKQKKARTVTVPRENLIVQMAGSWNMEHPDLLTTLNSGKRLNSEFINDFGRFVTPDSLYNSLYSSMSDERRTSMTSLSKGCTSQKLLSLEKNVPVKIRMFVWVEGQDVDCWNDIATGSVQINLEFAGKTRESVGE